VLATLLEDAAFRIGMSQVCGLVRQQLEDAGFVLGSWQPLQDAQLGQRRMGVYSSIREASESQPDHALELQVSAELAGPGAAHASIRLTQLTQGRPLVVGLLVVATQSITSDHSLTDPLTGNLPGAMVFVESDANGQSFRTIKVGQTFYSPRTWVPVAIGILLKALSQG
jgi:hypothetical protein